MSKVFSIPYKKKDALLNLTIFISLFFFETSIFIFLKEFGLVSTLFCISNVVFLFLLIKHDYRITIIDKKISFYLFSMSLILLILSFMI